MSDQIESRTSYTEKSFLKRKGVKTALLIIAVVFGIITVKGIAFAKKFNGPDDGPTGFIIDKISGKLDLSPSQKAQVDRLKEQIKEKMEANKPDHETMFKEFSEEFTKDKLNKNSILEHLKSKESKKEEMKIFMIDKLAEFHDILTPEQRLKVVELMQGMKDMRPPGGPGNFHDKKD